MPGPIEIRCVLVRALSPELGACERQDRSVPIDVERAQQQHLAYVSALRAAVDHVIEVPAAPELPDGVFVEDTAVMIDATTAVIARPGVSSRLGEIETVAASLQTLGVDLIHVPAPATLDGGDVLCVGQRFFVGLSDRTNAQGAEAFAAAAQGRGMATEILPVRWGLHLRTGFSLADEGTLLYYGKASLDVAPFVALGLECIAVDEPRGSNVLALGQGRVLVSAAAPHTAALLAQRGSDVTVLDVSELHKADGALTCPSVRVPAVGAWCT